MTTLMTNSFDHQPEGTLLDHTSFHYTTG